MLGRGIKDKAIEIRNKKASTPNILTTGQTTQDTGGRDCKTQHLQRPCEQNRTLNKQNTGKQYRTF